MSDTNIALSNVKNLKRVNGTLLTGSELLFLERTLERLSMRFFLKVQLGFSVQRTS